MSPMGPMAVYTRCGYRAENLEGGMEAWEKVGLPLVSADGGEPRVA